MGLKERAIRYGFAAFGATGLHRLAARWTRGPGAILMFHHVRPFASALPGYAPNRMLEITPQFLDELLTRLTSQGYEFITLDQAMARLSAPVASPPFVVLTFDDGYRDNVGHALPILRRHQAPFTLYVTTGFADHTARLWWLELEEAIARAPRVEVEIGGQKIALDARDATEKTYVFNTLYWALRALPEPDMLAIIADLGQKHGVGQVQAADLCMDWDEIRAVAADPLCTIGAHTLTHPILAKHDADFVRRELQDSRALLEKQVQRAVHHMAYPVGDKTAAGPREFELARAAGYRTAVTTRPGMLFPEHARHPTALPRVSINGNWQSGQAVDILLSGAPFSLWNKGRKVNAA